MYHRYLENIVVQRFGKGKAIIIVGPRQVGKTTLIKTIISNQNHLFFDGDDSNRAIVVEHA